MASLVGGRRIDSLAEVKGRSTLPALPIGGMPSMPMVDRVGRQVRFRTSSARSMVTGLMPLAKGNLAQMSSPRTLAASRACSARCGGISE